MRNGRGVQPVVGAVLMIAIVILLASLALVFFQGFDPGTPAPKTSLDPGGYVEYDPSTGGVDQYLELRHQAGENVDREALEAIVEVNRSTYSIDPESAGLLSAGDGARFNLSAAGVCGLGADSLDVQVVHEASNSVVVDRTVVIEWTPNLTVSNNTVSASQNFVASIEVVDVAASAGGGTIDPDVVNARVVLDTDGGETTLTPWPDGDSSDSLGGPFAEDINGPGQVSGPSGTATFSYTTGTLDNSTTVSFEMRAPKPNDWISVGRTVNRGGTTYDYRKPDASAGLQDIRFWIDSADPSDDNIILLTDGDNVPTYGVAASHQPALGDILGGKLGPSGTLSLNDDEVVVLYELSQANADPSNAPPPSGGGNPDYNDAVAVIDITPVGSTSGGSESSEAIYCG
jgi:archaeal flagellin N-terminal-like domain